MIITPELAAPIIQKLIPTLDVGINIIDQDGIIVAASDKSRLGTAHQGSKIAMAQNKEILVHKVDEYKGTKPGVTLPINFHDACVGAVGVTGDPDAIYKTAVVIKIAVESLVLQEYLVRQTLHKTRMLEEWSAALFDPEGADFKALETEAAQLGINTKASCAVIVIAFKDRLKKSKPLNYDEFLMNESFITSAVSSALKVNFASYLGRGVYSAAAFGEGKEPNVSMNAIVTACESLSARLESEKLSNYIGVGPLLKGLNGFRQSYSNALQSLTMIERLNYPKKIMHIYEWQILRLLYLVPDDAKRSFISQYFENKCLDAEDLNTLEVYFENDKNLLVSSTALHIHKNTLLYRLGRIKDAFGLDPKKFCDSMILQILIYTDKLLKKSM